jgi:hypothetical protein
MHSPTTPQNLGSNSGSARIFLTLVLGSVLLGGFWSLIGPGNQLIGTWQDPTDDSLPTFRFDADGSYWIHLKEGSQSFHILGSYQLSQAKGDIYRVKIETEAFEDEVRYRLLSEDQLVEIIPNISGTKTTYLRTADWVLTLRPSSVSESYEEEKPHLGCWQLSSDETFEFSPDGKLLKNYPNLTERLTYRVNYSQIPFHLDLVADDGKTEREIFQFSTKDMLEMSQQGLSNGKRAAELNRSRKLVRCSVAS